MTSAAPPTRRYDNTLRRERAGQTRERIVAAGAELLRRSSIRDWRGVTIRAVAERASVNERTVYRHFANERALRDAVMQHLESQVGIDLDRLGLDDVADAAARMFAHMSKYPAAARPPLDPTLAEVNRRQHDALLGAVGAHTGDWAIEDRELAAATLDVLWAMASYERLVRDWNLRPDDAIRGMTWVIEVVTAAIREGRGPAPSLPRTAARTRSRRQR